MHLSIDTREVDNGWVLKVEASYIIPGDPWTGKQVIHEVYGTWKEKRDKVVEVLEETAMHLKGDVPKKECNPVVE